MKKIYVDKDLLYHYYIEENLSIEQTAKKMNIGSRTIQRAIDSNNFHKNQEQIKTQRENIILEKYGVINAYQNEDVKKKIKEKTKQTLLKRYGITHNFKLVSHQKRNKNSFKYSDIMLNRDKLKQWAIDFKNKEGTKPTYDDLSKFQNCAYTTVNKYILTYGLKDFFKISNFSRLENYFEDFIKTLNVDYIKHDRREITPLELDFYFPNNRVAIEFNDIISHNSTVGFLGNNPIDKNYHFNKSRLCEEKDIRLIHIWEYEWFNERQRPILENIIKNALGINETKIYARKLDIEIRESKTMREFFDKNNIQGFRPGKFAICLVDKNTKEVYMSYMIGKCFFGKGKYEWEVIRGATKLNYTVVGGASKIWKYFIKTYKPNNCVYYVDYNYFNGSSLPYLGLDYITTQPGFKNWWVKEQQIKNREPMKHREITEKYKTGEVLQIYNAGTKVYAYEKKEGDRYE